MILFYPAYLNGSDRGDNAPQPLQEFRHMLDEIIKSRGIERFSKEGDINQWYRGIRVKKSLSM